MYKDICKLFLSPVNDFLSKLLNFFFEDKIRYSIFKNAPAFLLQDAPHAMHDILLLHISAILPEAISDGNQLPTETDLLLATYSWESSHI